MILFTWGIPPKILGRIVNIFSYTTSLGFNELYVYGTTKALEIIEGFGTKINHITILFGIQLPKYFNYIS